MMEPAGFFVSRSKEHQTDFGRSRSTVRSELLYKIEDTTGGLAKIDHHRSSWLRHSLLLDGLSSYGTAVFHGHPDRPEEEIKERNGMTLYEYLDRQIPDYYDTMYRDGYRPEQILHAARRKILQEYEARKAEAEAMEIPEVRIRSEVRIR